MQKALCEARPKSFEPVPGGWGRMGYTTVNLRTVSEVDLTGAVTLAHQRAAEPIKKRRKPR